MFCLPLVVLVMECYLHLHCHLHLRMECHLRLVEEQKIQFKILQARKILAAQLIL